MVVRRASSGYAAFTEGRRLLTTTALVLTVAASHCAPADNDLTTVDGRCTGWETLLERHQPPAGWDIVRMSRIMWRESRCEPGAVSHTSDTGLLQINRVNHRWLGVRLNTTVDSVWLTDPVNNIRAAAELCVFWERQRSRDCYHPWQVRR